MSALRTLLGYDEVAYEALRRRAKRNYRNLRQEARAILLESLREEIDAIRAERAAELPDMSPEGVMTP